MSIKDDIKHLVLKEFNRTGRTLTREEVIGTLHISETTLRHYLVELVSDGVFTRDINDMTKPLFLSEQPGVKRYASLVNRMVDGCLTVEAVEACRKYVKIGDKVVIRDYHFDHVSDDYQVDKPFEIIGIVGNQILLRDLKKPHLTTTITLKQFAMWLRVGKRGVIT